MSKYILRRLLLAIPTLFGITALIFAVMRLLPGDPLAVMFGIEELHRFTEEERARLLAQLGLDKPLAIQYISWLGDIARGNMGESFFRGDSVSQLIRERGMVSVEIGVLAVAFSWLMGIPAGIVSAMRPNSLLDAGARLTTVIFLAVPSFWLGLLVVLAGIYWFDYKSPIINAQLWIDPWKNFQIVIFPGVVLGLGLGAYLARMTRSSLFEVLREDYVRTARAKGLMERIVLYRHTLRNALLPVITLSGLQLGFVLGGSVAIEKVFGVPGLGRALVQGALERDMVVVQNLVLLYGMIFVVVNIVTDISYGWLDPRIRYE